MPASIVSSSGHAQERLTAVMRYLTVWRYPHRSAPRPGVGGYESSCDESVVDLYVVPASGRRSSPVTQPVTVERSAPPEPGLKAFRANARTSSDSTAAPRQGVRRSRWSRSDRRFVAEVDQCRRRRAGPQLRRRPRLLRDRCGNVTRSLAGRERAHRCCARSPYQLDLEGWHESPIRATNPRESEPSGCR